MSPLLRMATWRKAVLPVSLAANIFLLSYVGGQLIGASKPQMFRVNPQRPIERLAKRLALPDASLLHKAYRDRECAFTAARKDYDEAVARVLSSMAKPQLDPVELRKAMTEAFSHRHRIDDLMSETLLDTIEKMPPDSRAAFANSFKHKDTP